MVSIRRRSFGFTISEVSPCIIAIATRAESMIGRIAFGIPLELLESPPVEFETHIAQHLDALKNLHLLVLQYPLQRGITDRTRYPLLPAAMLQTSLKQRARQVSHTLVIVFCNSLTVAKCNTGCIRLQQPDQGTSIRPAASAEFTIGFPFARLYTEIPASGAFLVGGIQRKRNVVKIALKKLDGPLRQILRHRSLPVRY